jgi:hypothetical protein
LEAGQGEEIIVCQARPSWWAQAVERLRRRDSSAPEDDDHCHKGSPDALHGWSRWLFIASGRRDGADGDPVIPQSRLIREKVAEIRTMSPMKWPEHDEISPHRERAGQEESDAA